MYIFVVRVATFSSQVKGLLEIGCAAILTAISRVRLEENRISFQENRARSKGNIFVNENLCNGRPGETGEKGLLKIDAARNGGINGGSSVSITRGIIYQETSNNYCCLAHILHQAACNIVWSSTCLHCTCRRFAIFLSRPVRTCFFTFSNPSPQLSSFFSNETNNRVEKLSGREYRTILF